MTPYAMKVAYQGARGAYSEGAAAALFPALEPVPQRAFADVFSALAGKGAAETYGLAVLAEGIETLPHNYTRFFAIARRDDDEIARSLAPLSGPVKTSLVYVTKNVPGALVRSLQPFATAGIQLTKIESRPSRAAARDYVFYLDFEGDPAESPAREALALMRTCCEWITVLGAYRSSRSEG